MSDVREFEIRMFKEHEWQTGGVLQYRYKIPGTYYFDPVPRSIPDSYTEWTDVPVVCHDPEGPFFEVPNNSFEDV